VSYKSPPERGGGPLATRVVEGAHLASDNVLEGWGPSVSPAASHLPVPGRI
jgi:hypothetical protein